MKAISRLFFGAFLITTILFGASRIPLLPKAHAETAEELKAKIDARNADIDKLEQEIAQYTKDLDAVGAQANTLKSSIAKLDITKKKLLTDIQVTEKKISNQLLVIEKLSLEIGNKEDTISQNKIAVIQSVKKMQELDNASFMESVLSQENISNAWQIMDSLYSFQGAIKAKIESLKSAKESLISTKTDAEVARDKLQGFKSDLGDQKKIVDQNTNEKAALLKQTKNTEANYKKILSEKQALRAQFEKELADFESKLKFILNPGSLPGQGVLSWPLDSIYVTQQFGKTNASARLYVSGTHNGTDFKALMGTPVKSMGNGKVIGSGDTDVTCPSASFGRWILIQYDNGLSSSYGHLSLIK